MEGFDDEFSPMQGKGPDAKKEGDGEEAASGEGGGEASSSLRVSPPVDGDSGGGGSSGMSPAKNAEPREEPEVIKKWKEQQLRHLEEKDREEEKAKVALREKAKKELADWYAQHSEQLTKLQTTNRAASESAEKEFKSTTHEIKKGTEWERVAKLCDFNPKSARNVKDISRLRSVILQLKQGGPCTSVMQSSSST